jgi:uncharacterized membrane protein (UPF0182 family)
VQPRRWLVIGVVAAAVLLLVGRTATALYVDHAWFAAMGIPALFWEQVIDRTLMQGGAFILGSLFAFANLHAVRRTILAVAVPSRVANIELTAMVPGRRLLWVTVLLAMVVGAGMATPLTNWVDLALVRHGTPFGEIEGILDRDLGFYVYWLPFEEAFYLWALVTVVLVTAVVLVLYALTRSLRVEGRRLSASTHVRRHLSVLGALVLLLLAWSYRLDAFDLLQSGSGTDGLFLRVDHRVTLRMDFVLSYGCAIAAFLILRTGWIGQLRAAFITLTTVLASAVLLRHGAPAILARGDLLGDPGRRDLDYIASRALYSRRAFNVDGIRVVGADSAGAPLLHGPASTLGARASLWDRATLGSGLGDGNAAAGRATTAATASRQVDAVPVGWTARDGRITALRVRRPVASGERWTLAEVDATRPMVRDSVIELAPADSADAMRGWPLVAPGFDGPRLLDAVDAGGTPGVSLNARRSRIAHAWALREAWILSADSLATSPLIITHRDVRDRLQRVAPVFVQGDDVLPIHDNGHVYWAVQLYSASDRYPFSQRWNIAGGIYSYFRLAATALVDAGTGRVQLVPVERPDAIARTWMSRLPSLFTRAAALPPSLVAQLPPATESAMAQVRTFARYGSRLDGPVLRHLPDSALVGGVPAPHLVGATSNMAVAWSLPLLDASDQVDGVLTAVGGPSRATWWDAVTGPRLRWRAVSDALMTGADSARASLPDGVRRENRLKPGRISVQTTSRGALFVQPVQWLRGDGSVLIARVAVTDGRKVGIGATLAQAMAGVGERQTDVPAGRAPTLPLLAEPVEAAATRLYDAMRQAMRRGDWPAFGAAFDSLGRILGRPPQ